MSMLVMPLFAIMFFLAVVWLVLVSYLFHSLKKSHPSMYEALGSPRDFEPRTTQALFTFLVSRKPESLDDPGLLRLARFMRFLFPFYLVGFLALIYMVVRIQGAA